MARTMSLQSAVAGLIRVHVRGGTSREQRRAEKQVFRAGIRKGKHPEELRALINAVTARASSQRRVPLHRQPFGNIDITTRRLPPAMLTAYA